MFYLFKIYLKLFIFKSFISPFVHSLPELFPEETKKARFQFLVPKKWWNEKHKPVVFHFAGTGDHVKKIILFLIKTKI